MDVRNCRKCGRVFNYAPGGSKICPRCKDDLEIKFQEVKKFVQENRKANIPEICEACEVETGQLHQWIREERLVFSEDSAVGLPCEKCGKTIKSGRFCESCKVEMANTLNSAYGSKKKPEAPQSKRQDKENPRMRFLDKQ